MNRIELLLTGTLAFFLVGGCAEPANADELPKPEEPQQEIPVEKKDVTAYVTKIDRSRLFDKETFEFGKPGSMSPNQIHYDKSDTRFEVTGFGTAITTASGYNLLQMTPEDRKALLKETFSPEEAGSSLIRVSIGASDFCLRDEFTWCDKPGMENFGIPSEDARYLIPVLKEIYEINPDVKIIASPWSCPRWMKGTVLNPEVPFNSWTGGRLRPSCYDDYAEYFVRWIQTMEKEGFDIYAVTVQNEPLNKGNSISLYMPWEDQAAFVKVLGPAFQKAGLDTKILVFDHNYNYDNKNDQKEYPLHIYADPEAGKWVAGAAWHNYGGHVSELDNLVSKAPDKENYFTEASIGTWCYDKDGVVGGNFGSVLMNDFRDIIWGNLQRGSRGVTFWNFLLDDKRGPHSRHPGACTTCYGAVTVSSSHYKTLVKNSQWYNMAHASAVIRPGARLIRADGVPQSNQFIYAMYLNPDNTIGVMICNDTSEEKPIVFTNDRFTVRYKVPSKSLVSLRWSED